jgi:ABC-2 type transport system permease protein
MNKIILILQREYLTRVRKKSFLIATLLTPILIAAIYAIPALLYFNTDRSKVIQVIDESGLFKNKFKQDGSVRFEYASLPLEAAKKQLDTSETYAALTYVPKDILENPKGLKIYAQKNIGLELQNKIENTVQDELRNIKLRGAGIDLKVLEDSNKLNVSASTYSLEEGKEKDSSAGAATIVGFVLAFVLYLSVFIYGSQVMNGVIEEKNNRIIEVMVSSVKPFQLMMGKILGIGLVGLTQFFLWALLSFGISTVTGSFLATKMKAKVEQQVKAGMSKVEVEKVEAQIKAQSPIAKVNKALESLPIGKIIFATLFFFFGGYLLYSSLFAAVGSAVENPQEAQQFMWPVTIPVIIAIMLAQFVVNEPDGKIAFWASMIPFTSPINMVVRIPFGVEWWELILSMTLLVLGFLGTVWFAARIYRVGILMYGKKITYKELSKWIFYKG